MPSTTLLATDRQRSVLSTIKANQTLQAVTYSPYGHRPAASWLLNLLGFNGELADPMTGHYLLGNGYRAFNPVLMRFNCPDNLSPFGKGGLNSYIYCLGDPVNAYDPTGHFGLFRKIISATPTTIIAENGPKPAIYHLKNGITKSQGEFAIREMDRLITEAANISPRNALYLTRQKTIKHNLLSLNKTSLERVSSERYPVEHISNALPPPIINNLSSATPSRPTYKLLEYIKNHGFDPSKYEAFSMKKLHDVSNGKFRTATQPSMRPSQQSANRFYKELSALDENPATRLAKQAREIRDTHFERIDF